MARKCTALLRGIRSDPIEVQPLHKLLQTVGYGGGRVNVSSSTKYYRMLLSPIFSRDTNLVPIRVSLLKETECTWILFF